MIGFQSISRGHPLARSVFVGNPPTEQIALVRDHYAQFEENGVVNTERSLMVMMDISHRADLENHTITVDGVDYSATSVTYDNNTGIARAELIQ